MLMPSLFDLEPEQVEGAQAEAKAWNSLAFEQKIVFNRWFDTEGAYDLCRLAAVFRDERTGSLLAVQQPDSDREGLHIMVAEGETVTEIVLDRKTWQTLSYFLAMYNDALHRIRTKCLYLDLSSKNVPTTASESVIAFRSPETP